MMMPPFAPPSPAAPVCRASWGAALAALFALVGLMIPPARAQSASQEQQAIRGAVERVAASVVQIQPLGGAERSEEEGLLGAGPVSGLVVDPEGYILTSNYTLATEPASLLATLHDGTRLPATVVARDYSKALVLLKVDAARPLPVPAWGPTDAMRVGQWAIAMGKGFSYDQPNVSVGILSALDRIWGKAIQTDAKVSPSNYGGPLVDIRGRVMGILVPLSPHHESGLGGLEWYDSGIGFAVPLAGMEPRLEQLRQGHDLHPGLMGVSLKGSDIYADPAEIVACHPKSPADIAGLQPGDRIVGINDQMVYRQADLKQAMGPLYAGDAIEVHVLRGGETIVAQLELAAELVPYAHPFIGLLPARGDDVEGVPIRYVYPDSPAAEAGVRAGDVLVRVGEEGVDEAEQVRAILSRFVPGDALEIAVRRGEDQQVHPLSLAALPESVPADIPPQVIPPPEQPPPQATGPVSIKLPEESGECPLYVPPGLNPDHPYGLVVLLLSPGEDGKAEAQAWEAFCQTYNVILAVPPSTQSDRWSPTDADYLKTTILEITRRYPIDRARIVVHGVKAGGVMAYVAGFVHRELVRGLSVVDAVLPRGLSPPDNQPTERLAIRVAASSGAMRKGIAENVEAFRAARYPVTEAAEPGAPGDEFGRWVDALDRL